MVGPPIVAFGLVPAIGLVISALMPTKPLAHVTAFAFPLQGPEIAALYWLAAVATNESGI